MSVVNVKASAGSSQNAFDDDEHTGGDMLA